MIEGKTLDQLKAKPYYCQLPLEEYERMREENANVQKIKASIELILRELLDKGLLVCWYFNGTYHAAIRTPETEKLEKEFKELNRGVLK